MDGLKSMFGGGMPNSGSLGGMGMGSAVTGPNNPTDWASIFKNAGGGGSAGSSIGSAAGTGVGAGIGAAFGDPALGASLGGTLGSTVGGLFGGGGSSAPSSLQMPQLNNQPGQPVQPVGARSVGNSGPLTGRADLASILRQILARGGTL